MKIKKLCLTAALFFSASLANAATSNLVTNGSFSNGGVGWTLTGDDLSRSFITDQQWKDGTMYNDSLLSQTLDTTVDQRYTLSFDALQTKAGYQELGVIWNDVQQVFFNNTGTDSWVHHIIYGLVATNSQTSLTFFSHNEPDFNKIDNVNVSTVPVPAAVWLFGSGIAGLIGMAKRKKAALAQA